MLPPHRSSWQDPRVLGILLIVFLAGSVCGALAMRDGLHGKLHRAAGFWHSDPAVTFEKLKIELNLTPTQAVQMKSILDDMVTYRQDMEAQVESFRSTGKHRILDILTPEQRKRFEGLSSELPDR